MHEHQHQLGCFLTGTGYIQDQDQIGFLPYRFLVDQTQRDTTRLATLFHSCRDIDL